ncbi:MAG: peptide ABC transporter substrate-binding protein [Synergistaceae bacterium]|jgi:oligopeptide transport system substrate-binding protein|nr:peptide ABC transporter substrate-binding protein [Synergistaceae bacterium]
MNRIRQILLAIALVCVATLSVLPAQAAQNSLTFSFETEIPALDPQKSNSAPSFTVDSHVFENLVRRVDGKTTPGAAEKWEISEDGRAITFHLRESKWSDGNPVTAYDFECAFLRLLDPKTAAEYAFALYYLVGAEDYNLGKITDASKVGVKAVDDRTLVLTLKSPTPYFVGFLGHPSFAPVRKDILEKFGDSYATDADKAVYNGPFVLSEWKHEQTMVFTKNPNYWNAGAIKLDRAEIMIIPDTATALSMFENGEFDLVDIPPNLYRMYQEQGKAKLFYNGALDWMKFNLRPDPKKPWLTNKDFRKAVGWAINRESYTLASTKGLYVPALRFILPITQGVTEPYGQEYPLDFYAPKGDAAKAREFLAKALTELKLKASDITIEYLIQDQEETRLMAEALQQQIQNALGINVKIKLVTRMQRAQLEANGGFDTVYSGWMPDYDDPMSYEEIWITGVSHNSAKYASAEYDTFVRAAMSEKDAKKRMDMIFEAEKQILEDAPLVPLQLRRKAWMSKPNLRGFYRPLIGAEYDFTYAYFE